MHWKKSGIPHFGGFFKHLKYIEIWLSKYMKLNKTKLWYVIIKEIKNI